MFQRDNARLHVAKNVRDFISAQYVQLLPWPAYSPDMSPIETEWDWVGRRLTLIIRFLQIQRTNFGCACNQYRYLFHKQTFDIYLTSGHVI
ncbi:uncharacterized protein TNCV_4720341 [Trichonephila clavipes]|uniref:Tc1-like transposase DDE domain-containing protein n=1 Tax=Trichonephila clavipes TaxID=2585209 RepID=A0A8X6W615_TRICX|nr:uncharacterized protein TNCV_4720341 [Trichonephila clavipes]